MFTTCFQRDSRKDQIVVYTFIVATMGLLVWAGVKRVIERKKDTSRIDAGPGYSTVGR